MCYSEKNRKELIFIHNLEGTKIEKEDTNVAEENKY